MSNDIYHATMNLILEGLHRISVSINCRIMTTGSRISVDRQWRGSGIFRPCILIACHGDLVCVYSVVTGAGCKKVSLEHPDLDVLVRRWVESALLGC